MKIALIGYGKMGRAIEKLAREEGDRVVLRIGSKERHLLQTETLQRAEVAIEFSTPDAAFDNVRTCLEAGLPVVSGTTGWLERKPEIEALCRRLNGAFFYASNFSVGVNLFFAVNEHLAALMEAQPQYDVSLEETHHIHKRDAPSGTAITLAEQILARLSRKSGWVEGQAKHPEELGIRSFREDEVPGTHLVRWSSPQDSIELKHIAHSREGFARGALLAARWLRGRRGCFGMRDLLGF